METKYRKSHLQAELRDYCNEYYHYRPYTHVYCEIKGTPMYLNETEIRFLQVKCKEASGSGEFENFCKNVQVYDGPTKRGHKPMIFRPDGMFSTEFKPGFYTINNDLLFSIL